MTQLNMYRDHNMVLIKFLNKSQQLCPLVDHRELGIWIYDITQDGGAVPYFQDQNGRVFRVYVSFLEGGHSLLALTRQIPA